MLPHTDCSKAARPARTHTTSTHFPVNPSLSAHLASACSCCGLVIRAYTRRVCAAQAALHALSPLVQAHTSTNHASPLEHPPPHLRLRLPFLVSG